jgi:hypothetical protein
VQEQPPGQERAVPTAQELVGPEAQSPPNTNAQSPPTPKTQEPLGPKAQESPKPKAQSPPGPKAQSLDLRSEIDTHFKPRCLTMQLFNVESSTPINRIISDWVFPLRL